MSEDFDVAIVGLACRFPGAASATEFWRNLIGGVESITRFSDADLLAAGVSPEVLSRSDYVKASPVLSDPAGFDAAFFGIAPSEAATLDPQHRLLLELAHHALEDAGCDPARERGRIGVFAGSALNTYLLDRDLGTGLAENYIPTLTASDKDFLATRVSYLLGLRGPSLTVQSACSTSLVALHLARQSLLSEETDVALAGAVSVRVPHSAGYFYDGSGVVSPDGHVRAFDAQANGTVFGSGGGVIVLKRLADALAAGDHIHAVIKGSAINNDGSGKAAYTAPSVGGQSDVVVEALANAGLDAAQLGYLEAHGSGTPVGDRIELLALTNAFRQFTPRTGFCAIGSVKTNVGHLDAAAGMAGLIKTVLSLQHHRIPPTLHYTRPNAEIDFPATPFFVNAAPLDWKANDADHPRYAGVMGTGMGGTNAFVVLAEAPAPAPIETTAEGPHLLLLSAKTPAALDATARQFGEFLSTRGEEAREDFADIAYTLQTGRTAFRHRRFGIFRQASEAAAALSGQIATAFTTDTVRTDATPTITFLLPGVGDHYPEMARGLYERFAVFRAEVDRCAEILRPLLGTDVRELLYARERPEAPVAKPRGIDLKQLLGRGPGSASGSGAPAPARRLDRTIENQPALFTVEYALARLWMHWGVTPAAIVGHSMGEYVAACLAGVFSLEDALRLIATRARLVNELPAGAMVAVMLSEPEVLPLLAPELSIALINGPKLCVVAGPEAAIARFGDRLKEVGAIFRPVRNTHAFHSRLLDPIMDAFAREVKQVRLSPPQFPFTSNLTGDWITAAQATDPLYWTEQSRSTARFSDALTRLWRLPDTTLVEVGPGRTLGVLAMQHPARPAGQKPLIVSSLRHDYENQPDVEFIYHNLGRLWLAGTPVAWEKIDERAARQKVALPLYPFEHSRHWIESKPRTRQSDPAQPRADLADWFYVPAWKRAPLPASRAETASDVLWLILGEDAAPAHRLLAALNEREADVIFARFGASLRPGVLDDYTRLLASLKSRTFSALHILHLGALSTAATAPDADSGFYSLLGLAQALGEAALAVPVRLAIVTAQVHEVTGEESLRPAMATAAGLCGVISKEYPQVTAFAVDLPSPEIADAAPLLDEFHAPVKGATLAWRGRHRWERVFLSEKITAPAPLTGLRMRGVYLITGGTGGLGLEVARFLAKTCRARLVLTKKQPFDRTAPDADARVVQALREIEALGAEVEIQVCDVTDLAGMKRVVTETLAKYGELHGVIHAAGILREGLIQIKTREIAAAVLAPKVAGAPVVFEAVRALRLDFLALFSSVSSVVGFHGQSDYVAANAFLDAFAHYASTRASFRTVAIDWPVWRETGILTGLQAPAMLEARKEIVRQQAILTRDGIEIFRRALASSQPQLIVSPRDLAIVLAEAAQPPPDLAGSATATSTQAAAPRRDVGEEPRDPVEKAVADQWSAALGVSPIGIHENFIELGGHSLLAMRIVAQLRTAYQVNFTLRKFFEDPTVAGVALAIQNEIVAEIENLSEEEASQRVS